MRICYVLLSPTWGMHQYTADVANRMQGREGARERGGRGHEVHVVTTCHAPLDRYGPEITVHTPVATQDSGFSAGAIRGSVFGARRVSSILRELQPDVVHFTGPHLWNPLLLGAMSRAGVPTVHDLHDLHPHAGALYGRLLYLWNGWVRRGADHLLVHGDCWGRELEEERGRGGEGVTCTRLTHLFVGYGKEQALRASPPQVICEPWALFLGRLEAYKGLEVLVEAARRLDGARSSRIGIAGPGEAAGRSSGIGIAGPGQAGGRSRGIVIAGPGQLAGLVRGEKPANVEVRDRLILDEEAVDLFRHCGLVVLPYVEASQSALVAAAYFFGKPALVTRTGALPEYVVEGETGWVVPPGESQALAEALRVALADPHRLARMGRAGRAWYEEQRQAEGAALRAMYAGLDGCART